MTVVEERRHRVRHRRAAPPEDGLTLVELLVAMTILGVVLAALASGIISLTRATNTIDVRTENVDHARLAIATLSRDLRTAAPPTDDGVAFLIAEPRHARFYGRLGEAGVPSLIDIRLDADDRLVERVTPPTIASDGTPTWDPDDERQRFVASFLFNVEADDPPIFRYATVDGDGQVVPLGAGALDEPSRRLIRLVTIDLEIARDRAARVSPQRLTTDVRLPNL